MRERASHARLPRLERQAGYLDHARHEHVDPLLAVDVPVVHAAAAAISDLAFLEYALEEEDLAQCVVHALEVDRVLRDDDDEAGEVPLGFERLVVIAIRGRVLTQHDLDAIPGRLDDCHAV